MATNEKGFVTASQLGGKSITELQRDYARAFDQMFGAPMPVPAKELSAAHCGDALKIVLAAAEKLPSPLQDLTFSIAKLELQRGDVLVMKTDLTGITAANISALQALVPNGVRILFIRPEDELSVLSKAELADGEHRLTDDQLRNLYKAKGL